MLAASEQEDRHAPQLVDPQTPRFHIGSDLARLHRSRSGDGPRFAGAGPERGARPAMAVQPAGLRLYDLQPGVADRARGRARGAAAVVPTAAGVIGLICRRAL